MATWLSMTNEVLSRLRESQVATVTATDYSTLIGRFCNDSRRQVEDAWNWDALSQTITLTTVAGTTTYTLTGSGIRQRDITVNDSSNQAQLRNVPIQWIVNQQQLSTVQSGQPVYYAWNGTDGTDSRVEIYPTPDGAYSLKFNMVVPQVNLTADADIITVPSEPVIMGAYARALAERGEDGGLASSEAYGLFKSILADYIALESNRFIENDVFVAC
jgi:hypothetical protein